MEDYLEALETVFADHAEGRTANRPRTHTYTPRGPATYYMFKSMDGSWPRQGVHALRLSSDMVVETTVEGIARRIKDPVAPGRRWLGLVLLFDIRTTELLALIQDGYLQRMRVGATSGVAAKYLSAADARSAGMFGSGWQAGAQIWALAKVRPQLEEIKVYSPNPGRRREFVAEWRSRLSVNIVEAASPDEVMRGSQILVGATNSHEPVIRGDRLEPGVHVNSVQGHELDAKVLERADLIVVRDRERPQFYTVGDDWPREAKRTKAFSPGQERKVATLGEVVLGRAGRRTAQQVTVFGGGGMGGSAGLGVQFAAAAAVTYRKAKEAGLGLELPGDWFLEDMKP
jgi:alanine dehydrogenase